MSSIQGSSAKDTAPLSTKEGTGGGLDSFLTISSPSSGQYTEKRSKFLAFAFPVSTVDEVKTIVDEHRKKYYDARHVCWAYMLGHERLTFRSNDDGEPSGTAGKPILGQLNSRELTNVLVIVVRYFGGVKLGTSGLIQAYKAATQEALDAAEVVERLVEQQIDIRFDYLQMNAVMRIVKEEQPTVLNQQFDNSCTMSLSIRATLAPHLLERLSKVEGLNVLDN